MKLSQNITKQHEYCWTNYIYPEELAFADKIMKENGMEAKGINGAIKPLEVKEKILQAVQLM
jgi:hypothetical protein